MKEINYFTTEKYKKDFCVYFCYLSLLKLNIKKNKHKVHGKEKRCFMKYSNKKEKYIKMINNS